MSQPTRRSLRARASRSTTTRWLRIVIPVLLIFVWLVGGSIGGPYFGKVDEVSTNDQSSFLPESADATRVADVLPEFLGDDSIPALVVATADGDVTEAQLAGMQELAETIADLDGVNDGVSPPIVSDDGEAVQIFVPISTDESRETVETVRATVQEELPAGMEAWVTGPAGFTADLVKGFTGIDGLLLGVALGAVFLILIIVYRS
ncbi:MAG TPA: MMPL family transporter, partial [Microbacterium sp.]|nr:MMPL family transporter [Microbacterium sp.]